ncbi:MAG: glutamate--tRNA ligase family protein, partial [Myxococcota bacterium]
RIEDTDAARSLPKHTEQIFRDLRWLGLEWSGEPVYQSRRGERYAQQVQALLDAKRAYRDRSGAVYFRMPSTDQLVVEDRLKGRVAIAAGDATGTGDYVIQRADGSATFMLANVVDDIDMEITHVIRGDDHLVNAARQVPLYRALGAPPPEFIHIPLIMDDEGEKLSKRKGSASVGDFRESGYAPQPLVSHLAALGLGLTVDRTSGIDDLADALDVSRWGTSQSFINHPKLDHLNRRWLAGLPAEELGAQLRALDPALCARLGEHGVAALVAGGRMRDATYAAMIRRAREMLAPRYSSETFGPSTLAEVGKIGGALASVETWDAATLKDFFAAYDQQSKVSAYHQALRWALTGSAVGLPLEHVTAIVGRDEVLNRCATAQERRKNK